MTKLSKERLEEIRKCNKSGVTPWEDDSPLGTISRLLAHIDALEGEKQELYSVLTVKQEPLGKEFEKVLYDNLWDLYQDFPPSGKEGKND